MFLRKLINKFKIVYLKYIRLNKILLKIRDLGMGPKS